MIPATIEDIAFALTKVVASIDDDPYSEARHLDILIAADMLDLLRAAHTAAHELRRSKRATSVLTAAPLAMIRAEQIEHAIAACDGHLGKAAAMLGINPSTLYRFRNGISQGKNAQRGSR